MRSCQLEKFPEMSFKSKKIKSAANQLSRLRSTKQTRRSRNIVMKSACQRGARSDVLLNVRMNFSIDIFITRAPAHKLINVTIERCHLHTKNTAIVDA